jgi:hypothetical protein
MPLRDQRQARALAFGEFGQGCRPGRTVLNRPEVSPVPGAEAVAELIDGPQVDARAFSAKPYR